MIPPHSMTPPLYHITYYNYIVTVDLRGFFIDQIKDILGDFSTPSPETIKHG
jgi:hypothetical protein